MRKSTLLTVLVLIFFIVTIGGLGFYFMTQSRVYNLVVDTSPCYFYQGKSRIDLNISWENPCEDRYHIISNNEKIPIEARNVGGISYASSVTLDVDKCFVNKTFVLLIGLESNKRYYESTIPLFYSSEKEYNYSLYLCPYGPDHYGTFDREECFSSPNKVNSTENIHISSGEYVNGRQAPRENMFVVFEPCVGCRKPRYIELDTSTSDRFHCSIRASVDPNNISVYNQQIYPSEEYGGPDKILEANDTVDIPIEKYILEDIISFKITPRPWGYNLTVNSFRIIY